MSRKARTPLLTLLLCVVLLFSFCRKRPHTTLSSALSEMGQPGLAARFSPAQSRSMSTQLPSTTSAAEVLKWTPSSNATPTFSPTLTATPTFSPTPTATPTPTPLRVISYTVQSGDTLWSIASSFGLHVNTLRWSNPDLMHHPDYLRPGQVLAILPSDGVYHTIRQGETLSRIASRYGVKADAIKNCPLNDIPPSGKLQPGQKIVIPGGSVAFHFLPPRQIPGYNYQWPLRGVVTQEFHDPRNPSHNGIDIASLYGAPVYASRSGKVRMAKFDRTGYGFTIVIDHQDGWSTLYGHLEGFLVHKGDWVQTGQMIARLGGTGNATGPHVHFEIRHGVKRYNPRDFLPPESTQ